MLFTGSALALELGSPFDTPLGRQYRAEVEALSVPGKALPATCRLAREVKGAAIFPATTNPFVTEDPALLRFVSQIGFGADTIADATTAFSVLYQDSKPGNEIGVWALRFRSAGAASKARGSMRAQGVLVRGSLVATVWRDGEAGRACQSAIEAQLLKNGFAR